MVSRRPYKTNEEVKNTAEIVADQLTDDDWLEAFSHHPRIGDRAALAAKFAAQSTDADRPWEAVEQSGAAEASDDVLDAIAAANAEYDRKNGFLFLICATGKSAEEMLVALNERLENDATTEMKIAASEQRKITQLRLDKLLT